ncbi:MAG: hypothetical protein AB7F28_00220 [Candidatus Margulisiibacteriota bacterium]
MIKVKKVKLDKKDEKIEILWEVDRGPAGDDELSLRCKDEARPEFYSAIQSLAKHWKEVLELDSEKIEPQVSSVSFSWTRDDMGVPVMGVTIYASVSLNKSTGVWGCNTPHRIESFYSQNGGDEGQLMSDDLASDCKALLSEAEHYIQGERAQQNLFSLSTLDSKKFDDCTPTEQNLKASLVSRHVREKALEKGLVTA